MSELAAKAERLRIVKDACLDFITLWAMDRMIAEARSTERLWIDVLESNHPAEGLNSTLSKFGRGLDD